ncbi:MAG TPA: bifunctional homocysteine S-methyltransferase/methylenetetrahydrofolate reductase [Bryobacteraceae bacterium]|nr:bifunctional homocysteine S-methyltransferase/methylenetetrahydrofolate reductase [Bryobacteraceae bacterium]HPT29253.1 bifunctional homocysteine S-methyltransferase/methylenetetrahydrofolate reductase [Bryobacteraceae bacterium]
MSFKSRAIEFREKLQGRVIVADGAMGTMLYSRGVFINRCYDELNLSAPAMVGEIHTDYIKAGAGIIETNTFGATRPRLAGYGLGDKVDAINRAGVRLAKQAAEGKADVFVAGAMGPLGLALDPLKPETLAEARQAYREQAEALVGEGVDLIFLETISSIAEMREALGAVRAVAGDEMVIVAHLTIDDFGYLHDGTDIETYARFLDDSPADVVGINCSVGPKATLEALERVMAYTKKPLSAMPNAGAPTKVEGRNIYLSSPEYMAQYARRMIWAGVKIVGGCCGTTPEHIKCIKGEAKSLQPGTRSLSVTVESAVAKVAALPPVPTAQKSALGAKIAAGKFVAFVEILPPRGVDAAKEIAGSRLCKDAGIDAINVPDGPRASARMSAQVTCQLIERDAGIESVLHVCCRDRNILGIQSELLGAHAAGIRNLICITGDPPRMGSYPDATAVFDVDSIGLANIVTNLNHGLDIGGNPIGSQTALLLGVGANPGAQNPDEEVERTRWKVEAGAEFIVTQPVFDVRLLERFLKRIEALKIPLISGIWPLTSLKNAEFMVNELRVPVPEEFMERMRLADSPEKARAEGVRIAQTMVGRVKPMVQGVGLSAPFGRYAMAIEVAASIGPR